MFFILCWKCHYIGTLCKLFLLCFMFCVFQQLYLLIQSAHPKSRPVGIIVFAYVVRPSVPTFQIWKNTTTENNVRYWRDYGSGRVDHWWHLFCSVYVYNTCVAETIIGSFNFSNMVKTFLSSFHIDRSCLDKLNWPKLFAGLSCDKCSIYLTL